MPDALEAEREELETVYRSLCQDISEIGGVIRRLNTMTGYAGTVAALHRVERRGSEQQIKLRQSAGVLGRVAELYRRAELKNMDGDSPKSTAAYRAGWDISQWASGPLPVFRAVIELCEALCEPRAMLNDAGRWFNMEVVIPRRK